MQVDYQTSSLKKLVESESKLFKKFKDINIARWVLSRIRHFEMSEHLLEFFENQPNCRIHSLKGGMKWQIAIDAVNKTCPIRIVFKNKDWEDITQDMFNQKKWKTVTCILILGIWDYH